MCWGWTVPSVAQGVDAVRFDTANWTFAPAVTPSGEILGFLSWAEEEVIGDNVSLLWYARGTEGEWVTWGWKHDDIGAAAIWLRDSLEESSLFLHDHEIPDFIWLADPDAVQAPSLLSGGLFESDPLAPMVAVASDPSTLLDALVNIGYEAAPTVSGMQTVAPIGGGGTTPIGPHPIPNDCLRDAGGAVQMMLNDLLARAESLLETGEDLPAGRACAWPCTCTTTVVIAPSGPWTSAPYTISTGGQQECRFSQPATRTVTKTGLYWFCISCASTTIWNGYLNDDCCSPLLPGDSCPTSPPAGSTPFFTWPTQSPGYP